MRVTHSYALIIFYHTLGFLVKRFVQNRVVHDEEGATTGIYDNQFKEDAVRLSDIIGMPCSDGNLYMSALLD